MNAMLTLAVLMASLGMVPPSQDQRFFEFSGRGYTLQIPSELKAEKEFKADFEITTISRPNGGRLMSVYAGLHPDFGSDAPRTAMYSTSLINGMPAQRLAWTPVGGETCTEVLVTVRSSPPLTLSAHFSYCLSSLTERSVVESIIQSVKLERTK